MAKEKFYQKITNKLNDKKYFIMVIAILIFLPFLQGVVEIAGNYPNIFILSDLYSILVQTGLVGSNYAMLKFFTLAMIMAIFAASWDMLSGYTGQFNFGHAMFFGFAAYFFYIFTSADKIISDNTFNDLNPVTKAIVGIINQYCLLPPMEAFFISALASAVLALFVGLLALRLKGAYFALVSLVLPLIFYYAIRNSKINLFPGKELGVPNIPTILHTSSNDTINALNLYYFTLLILLISIGFMMLVAYSRLGDIFLAIREDEEAAESIGINTARYKILAFIISAYFAGLAGNLFAQYQTSVGPSMFSTQNSFQPIIYTVIGGIGTIYGGALGAIIITLAMTLYITKVFNITGLDYLIYGLGLILVLLYLKTGIVRAKSEQKRALVLGFLFALGWMLISQANYSSLNLSDTIFLAILAILTLPLIPFFIVAEPIGIFVLNNVFSLGLTSGSTRTLQALFLIDTFVGIPLAYYYPKIFKKIRLRIFGVWPSIGLYEPE